MSKIIAHRGASKAAPQNTVPAFKKAREFGCDGFENDVHLTKDGVIVVCHNYDIDETSTGSGFIKDMTFDELRSYDFGSYFGAEFAGTKIPTLDEFLDCCEGLEIINIEIKQPPDMNIDIVAKTIDAVKARGFFDNLIISSFCDEVLIRCKEYAPDVKTGLLYSPNNDNIDAIADDPVAYVKKLGCDAVHPYYLMVSEDYIEDFHNAGIMVNPWTVDGETAIVALRDAKCDGIITNVPDFARTLCPQK